MSSVRSSKLTSTSFTVSGWWIKWGVPGSLALLFIIVAGTLSLTRHPIGDYGVETDFYWDYAPAADALLRGELPIERYSFRGPGYPFALAGISLITSDAFLAGKIISVLSAGIAIWMIFYLLSKPLGPVWAAIGVILVALNGVFLEYAIRTGTDMFFTALNLLFFILIGFKRSRSAALAMGFVAGYAFLTRYNGVALILTLVVWALFMIRSSDVESRKCALFAGIGVVVTVVPWLFTLYLIVGDPFYNLNSVNVLYEVLAAGRIPWDQFWYSDIEVYREKIPTELNAKVGLFVRVYFENFVRHFVSIGDAITGWIMLTLGLVGGTFAAFRKIDVSAWRWMMVAALFNYLVLCTVFYSDRFYLPLLPVIIGMGLTVLSSHQADSKRLKSRFGSTLSAVALLSILIIGFPKNWDSVVERLSNDPVEILEFASRPELDSIVGERIAARKPHFPYLTQNDFVPLPMVKNFSELTQWMRDEKVEYLFLGHRGANTRPVLWSLLGSPVSQPEFALIAYSTNPPIGLWRLCNEPSSITR